MKVTNERGVGLEAITYRVPQLTIIPLQRSFPLATAQMPPSILACRALLMSDREENMSFERLASCKKTQLAPCECRTLIDSYLAFTCNVRHQPEVKFKFLSRVLRFEGP
jgi:hypothetical protein